MNIRSLFFYFGVVLFTANGIIPVNGGLTNLSAQEMDEIKRREAVIHDVESAGVSGIEAWFEVRAQPKKIWAGLTNYSLYPVLFKSIEKIHVIEENDSGAIIELRVNSVIRSFQYTMTRKYVIPGKKIDWNRISGDFRVNKGSWEIYEVPGEKRSILCYRTFIGLEGFIGKTFQGMIVSESKKRIPGMVDSLRKTFEQ